MDNEIIEGAKRTNSLGRDSMNDKLGLQRSRIINDAELLELGAEYEFAKDGEIILNPTLEQKENLMANWEKTQKQIETNQKIENQQMFEIVKDKLETLLKKEEILEEKDGYKVVDIDKLKDGDFFKKYKSEHLYKRRSKNIFIYPSRKNFISSLGSELIVPKNNYSEAVRDKKDLEPIPLFNIPESLDDAFNVEKIKNKKYALNAWDIYGYDSIKDWENFNIEAKNGELINVRELYIATSIYKTLNGKRNLDGNLIIFEEGSETGTQISKKKLSALLGCRPSFFDSSVLSKCPNLRRLGLLIEDDDFFREETRPEVYGAEKIGGSFTMMIDGVNYYIGKGNNFIFYGEKIPFQDIKAVVIDSRKAGIVRIHGDREEIIYTIDLLTQEEKDKKFEKIKEKNPELSNREVAMRTLVNKKDIYLRIKKYRETDYVLPNKNETAQQYAHRISRLPEYKYVRDISNELSAKIGVGIHNLSWREQLQITNMAYSLKFFNEGSPFTIFSKKYKLLGLKAFISLEQGGKEMGQKILDIGEKYDQEIADKIFAKYAELADYAQDSARYLAKEFNIDDESKAQEIAEHLLRRGKALLAVCAEENLSSEQVIYKLNNIKAETDIFKESFKLVKSGGEKFSLEKINAIQLKIKAGVELLREEKTVKRMKEIYLENYHNFPEEFKQKIIESLDKKLANPQAKFYTLYHNGEIVAFNSFTPQEDGTVHFANFNVDPRYNYAKLGEAMMEVSLDKEAQENTIVAEAIEGLPIAETYLNKKGFQKTGEAEVAGIKLINIRREKTN